MACMDKKKILLDDRITQEWCLKNEQKCYKYLSECTILHQFLKNFLGEHAPRPL